MSITPVAPHMIMVLYRVSVMVGKKLPLAPVHRASVLVIEYGGHAKPARRSGNMVVGPGGPERADAAFDIPADLEDISLTA